MKCYKCGNDMTDIKTVQKLHKHFLFYLTSNNRLYSKYILKFNATTNHDLDFKYFKGNAKTEKMGEIAIHYMVKCDACLQFPIRTTRWKCCNCFSKNLCDKCKNIIETKEEGYEELLWNLINAGYRHARHCPCAILGVTPPITSLNGCGMVADALLREIPENAAALDIASLYSILEVSFTSFGRTCMMVLMAPFPRSMV